MLVHPHFFSSNRLNPDMSCYSCEKTSPGHACRRYGVNILEMSNLLQSQVISRRSTGWSSSTIGLIFVGVASLYIVFQVTSHQHIRAHHEAAQSLAQSNSENEAIAEETTVAANDALPDLVFKPAGKCHIEENNEYHGDVVKWGDKSLLDTAEACCDMCASTLGCNVWVYCSSPSGCGGGDQPRPHKECWLKKANLANLLEHIVGRGHPGISWTSGSVYTAEEYSAAQLILQEKLIKEQARKKALHDDEELPLVFMDVAIDGKLVGRIEAVLFMKDSPLAAENMRQFCTGEKGKPYHLEGAYFYRIIDRFIDQTGVEVSSIYGGKFNDDPGGLKLQHERPYLLSIANGGPNTNTAHFSITVAPAHHLDGLYVIFGECVSGFEAIEQINALSKGQKNNELLQSKRAQIVATGQLRRGTYRAPPAAP